MTTTAIAVHLFFRYALHSTHADVSLVAAFLFGGIPLIAEVGLNLTRGELGADVLAPISVVSAVLLKEYLAAAIVILMLASGGALESYAVAKASAVLQALAKRMPTLSHRRRDGQVSDVAVTAIAVTDILLIYPHEICPVDGVVVEGHGTMDESFLTGEPFRMAKTPGSAVISGAINGSTLLTVRASRLAADSRYAKIMEVMRASEEKHPRLRRLGDQLAMLYVPLTLLFAGLVWLWTGSAYRFLSILVVATPCPLLIGIPVAVIGSITLAARRSIIIKNPAILEQISACRTIIFDKTGTLTYGKAALADQLAAPGFDRKVVLALTAGLEQYSKHPLADAVRAAARVEGITLAAVIEIHEDPGQGLRGKADGHDVRVTSRKKLLAEGVPGKEHLPPGAGGLECHIVIDGTYAATYRFRDAVRPESMSFIGHLRPKHAFEKEMILSGDRESEVRYLADEVGIHDIHADQSPEQKLAIVQREVRNSKTLFVGDGINDAPALRAATVGVALGQNSDITNEAAGAVIMDSALHKVDELMHIGRHMHAVALQSAVGGMVLSVVGMVFAAAGRLPPVAGAVAQEIIDVFAILNALRAAFPPKTLTDF